MTRDQLLAFFLPAIVTEPVSGVGDLRIRQVTEPEVKAAREAANKDNGDFCRRLVVAAVVGDDNQPLLNEGDLPALAAGAFGSVDLIVGAVLKANRIGQAEATAKN